MAVYSRASPAEQQRHVEAIPGGPVDGAAAGWCCRLPCHSVAQAGAVRGVLVADFAGFEDEGTLVLEQRFAIVPEWIIDAQLSDCAFRLYAVLLRYGHNSGQRMPGRALLARRLHKGLFNTRRGGRSYDTTDSFRQGGSLKPHDP